MTNSGVPVSLIDSDANNIFPTDLTVQPPHFYVESLNATGIANTEGESAEPLFRITIVRFTKLNSTLIGVRHSHVLCTLPLNLPGSYRCVDGNDFSRWIWCPVLSQATVPTLPGPRTDRPSALLRTRGD